MSGDGSTSGCRLQVSGLTKRYGATTVLAGVGFSVPQRAPLVVRGGNGAGKTTLLRCLAGAEPLDAGQVVLDGQVQRTASLSWWGRVHGVLDDMAWFPDLTITDHLRLLSPGADAGAALARFGVAGLGNRLAASLSSGQLRRAALATILVRPWEVLVLDEPEQRLDEQGVAALGAVLAQLCEQGRVVVLSTHSAALAERVGGKVLHLEPVVA